MADRTCTQCPARLSGRQLKYCTPRCAATGLNHARIADGRLREYRKRTHEQRAQYQRDRRRGASGIPTRDCEVCGTTVGKIRTNGSKVTCSFACRVYLRGGKWPASPVPARIVPRPHAVPPDRRSPLRRAWETCDWPAVIAHMLARAERYGDCRLWTGARNQEGYGHVRIGKKYVTAYRVMAVAMHEGEHHIRLLHVHHTCANRLCIEPDHLQAVPPEANIAEMLHRNYYLQRIAQLEAALAECSPNHMALTSLPFAV